MRATRTSASHARGVWQGERGAPLQVQRARPRRRARGRAGRRWPCSRARRCAATGPRPGVPLVPTPSGGESEGAPVPDPFAYDPDREDALVERAAAGTSHVLYARSPGGAAATAERVARWRPQVEAAARAADVEPDLLEGLVFLESAGREDAMAGDTEGAVGLTQILAETGRNLLGMQVDVERSARLTARIDRALRRGRLSTVLAAAARAPRRRRALRPGQGARRHRALPDVRALGARPRGPRVRLLPHGHRQPPGRAAPRTAREQPSYARLYFDSTPIAHAAVQRRLAAFGDDSSNYLWKLYAAREIMRLYREDRAELARLEALQTAKNSAEEVLHPPASTPRFATPAALRAAWDDGEIRALPDDPVRTGLARDPRMGELAARIGADARPVSRPAAGGARDGALHRRPDARVRRRAGPARGHLDRPRRASTSDTLVRRNREATRNYSLHTTGWAFDIARELPLQAPGARVPVRARPPAGAERDRLGARARRDPRDRRRRRRVAAAAARAARATARPAVDSRSAAARRSPCRAAGALAAARAS